MSDWNNKIIEEFRANGGKVGGNFKNTPIVLLHTIGAKSGQERVNPLAYHKEGDKYVVIASKGGAPTNPDWYYNIGANSAVEVEVGTEKFKAQARVAQEPERSQLYDAHAVLMPGFNDYKKKTTRQIPVIVLTRLS